MSAVMNGVSLSCESAFDFYRAIMQDVAELYPDLQVALDGMNRGNLGDRLVEFEAIRAGLEAPNRVGAAQYLVGRTAARFLFDDGESKVPLTEHMAGQADPLPLSTTLGNTVALVPHVPYQGVDYQGRDRILELRQRLIDRHAISLAAGHALERVAGVDAYDLSAQKFVILGAAAELAPTEILLRGGATVLFVDLASCEKYVADRSLTSGTVVFSPGGMNLLRQPLEIAATIREFSDGSPVHVGAFAYVGGAAREWRLTQAMNSIIESLDPGIISSVGLYISPTSPAQADEVNALEALQAYDNPSVSDRLWRALGGLKPNIHQVGNSYWPRSTVSVQGASYQAAQNIGKGAFAEVMATRGLMTNRVVMEGQRLPITVSANIAGITQTQSMNTPVFRAGFAGAPSLGLETYAPETTRWLSGLLYLDGITDPRAPGHRGNPFEDENDKARRLRSLQVHGGVYAHPYALEGAIRRAALIGLGKRPRLIPGFVRSLMGK